LLLVANSETSDVIVAPSDLEWLYHPYDGGADVTAASTGQRDELWERHSDWLSKRSDGL